MLTSAEAVFECCRRAKKRGVCSRVHPRADDLIAPLLCLPRPHEVNRKDLEVLISVYLELLDESNIYYQKIFKVLKKAQKEPDAAVLLLYFLGFPCSVVTTRPIGTASAHTPEIEYQFHPVFERISSDRKLGRWCRKAIGESKDHHVLVLTSSVCIL